MVFDTQFSKFKRRMTIGVLACAVVGYFAFHAFHGNYGIIAHERYTTRVESLSHQLADLQAERHALEHRVSLLKPESIDPDMLEERVSAELNLAHPNDVEIMRKQSP